MSFAVSERADEHGDPHDGHALPSYLFGTVVIAVAINLVTSLGQS